MPVRVATHQSSNDAAEYSRGQQAYWNGLAYPAHLHPNAWFARGWIAASVEARQTCIDHKAIIKHTKRIQSALHQAGAAIRAITPVKPRPAQTNLVRGALTEIQTTLALIGPEANDATTEQAAAQSDTH